MAVIHHETEEEFAMEKKENKKKHLPLYGIGPALCFPMALVTAVCIWLAKKGYIPGEINNIVVKWVLFIVGILLIIEGVVLFFGADLNGNLQKNIKANQLKTNGSYKFVRNPCYCLFLFGCTGTILIFVNWVLLVLPFLFWLEMTIVLKNTEEKWLANLYGQEYADYCKRVNRCIPWFPRKKVSDK